MDLWHSENVQNKKLKKALQLPFKVWEQLQDKHSKVMQNSYRWKHLAILM